MHFRLQTHLVNKPSIFFWISCTDPFSHHFALLCLQNRSWSHLGLFLGLQPGCGQWLLVEVSLLRHPIHLQGSLPSPPLKDALCQGRICPRPQSLHEGCGSCSGRQGWGWSQDRADIRCSCHCSHSSCRSISGSLRPHSSAHCGQSGLFHPWCQRRERSVKVPEVLAAGKTTLLLNAALKSARVRTMRLRCDLHHINEQRSVNTDYAEVLRNSYDNMWNMKDSFILGNFVVSTNIKVAWVQAKNSYRIMRNFSSG